MISIDIDKARLDAAQLREIALHTKDIAAALEKSRTEHQTTWQGGAGTEFQEFAARLCAQMAAFSDETTRLSEDISRICTAVDSANQKL